MSSFDIVNYSLRPSKAIQRQLVFEGISKLHLQLGLDQSLYVGLGSVWFTDFILAHQLLNVSDMISMEKDEIGFLRAQYNAPYATVEVRHGSSNQILPELLDDSKRNQRPWIVWLDYDSAFDEVLRNDVRLVIEGAPVNTTFLITFNAHEKAYGYANERPGRLKDLFGAVVPDGLSKDKCKTPQLQETLAGFSVDFMKSVAAGCQRPGGFVSSVRMVYQDGASMVTVGGMLPSENAVEVVRRAVEGPDWRCKPENAIRAPHLTIREALALQAMLPSVQNLSRAKVQELGFDLKEEQIQIYEKYYREYPSFAEIRI